MTKGKYIVIEGPEGVGKTTQAQMIADGLRAAGLPVKLMREPDSQNDLTARAIRHISQDPRYPMNTRTEVLLYNAARSQSLEIIRGSVNSGVCCVVDRNYLTTLAIQYYGRGDIKDYDKIIEIINFAVGDMEPDLTLIMDAETQTLMARQKIRHQGDRFDNLEAAFLDRVRSGYLWEAKQRNLPIIYATGTKDEVFKEVWKHVASTLSNRVVVPESAAAQSLATILAEKSITTMKPTAEPVSQIKSANNEDLVLLEKSEDGNFVITQSGEDYLSKVITNTKGNVYAFTSELSPTTIAAAMARLSRRGDDMRITILDEFANQLGKDDKLLQRVITAYGDDSVQQLAGIHFVVENASNLLTKKLEWGRLAAYLEQSTRYIYYDKKDKAGRYRYYQPAYFKPNVARRYKKDLDRIFELYSGLVHNLAKHLELSSKTPKKDRDGAWRAAIRAQACDAARPVLPVATTSTVGIFASGQALESLILHLQSDQLPEANDTGNAILTESRKVLSTFLERSDKPDRGGAIVAYRATKEAAMRDLTKKLLPAHHSTDQDPVTITDYWPHNELDLVPDMLYENSSLSAKEIKSEVTKWPYQQKVDVLTAYMGERLNRRHRPGRALEKAHYSLDLICDYGIFRDLQRHRMVDDLEWQQLTPRYGYEIPELVEKAGCVDIFEECFSISLALYSFLQENKYDLEAQYTTLLGHKMRWKVTFNAREAFHFIELRTSPQGHPGYRKLTHQIYEKICEIHPLLGEAMRFVNKDEDPELSRLAAERYSQYKLKTIK
jgi:dTMP kinase